MLPMGFTFEDFVTSGIIYGDEDHEDYIMIEDIYNFIGSFVSEKSKTFTIPKTVTRYGGKEKYTITGIGYHFLKSMFQPSDGLRKLYKRIYYRYKLKVSIWMNHIETIIIPNSVESIAGEAFYNSDVYRDCNESFIIAENLKNIIIPDSITQIGTTFEGNIDYNTFKDIPHIEYHGSASGAPWGAKSMN